MADFRILEDFVAEREEIRRRKEAGESYTTLDPILGRYRFCNVRRKDDRVSRWLLKNYYTDTAGDVWFRALIARLINWPPTLDHLMKAGVIPFKVDEFSAFAFCEAMKELEKKKEKMYSSAYVVYPTNIKGNTKAFNMCWHIIVPAIELTNHLRWQIANESIQAFTTVLADSFGIKTFIAGQVSADLTYIRGQLDNAHDLYYWAPMGPGSLRGLNRLHNRKLTQKIKQHEFNDELFEVRGVLLSKMPALKDMTLHDVQNVMCEYDKYIRVLKDEGAPRQLYRSERAF
jgi:alpha-glutamyl/putrescinyl thymine pyrophosphorylase clade 1